ncbi:hypothetical protein NX059_000499 [Plenodomus lindquistii]|nr:hypothetical protein NX059_000499 [Plenodomus lindquistii]
MEANIRFEDAPLGPSPSIEITCAHYGGVEAAAVAKILFNEGFQLRVHSVEPRFEEAWPEVFKTTIYHSPMTSPRRSGSLCATSIQARTISRLDQSSCRAVVT